MSSQAIVGREEPLRVLEGLLVDAAAGRPHVALVAGEAGVGKTRLVQELDARARARGFAVLRGDGVELGGDELAYAPLIGALRDLPADWILGALADWSDEARERVAAVLPRLSLGRPSRAGHASQGPLYELVLDLLGRFAGERAPLLVVLEDLHWADPSTLAFLAFLARNVREERIALAVTYRDDERALRRLVSELARRSRVVRIELEPLGPDDVARQLEGLEGRPVPASLAAEIHARTGGNPFFVEELYAARRAGSTEVPATVAEAVLLRVEQLGAPGDPLLAIVAVAGGRIAYALLERIAPDGAAALRAAVEARILVRDPGDREVAFRHALMGEVIYANLFPRERAALHARIARALAANHDAPAAQLAHHWQRAGEPEPALAASVTAGVEAAQVSAFAEASVHLERALELWDAGARTGAPALDRVELLSQAARAARFAGDRERAVAHLRDALAEVDRVAEPVRAALLYERLGECFWDDEAALGCYREALALLPERPSPERARLLAVEGHALMGLRRWDEAGERCEAALRAAVGSAARAEEARARITLGLVLAFAGHAGAGERHLRRALAIARALGDGESIARAYVHLGELLRLRGERARAFATMQEGEAAAARLGLQGSFGQFMHVNAVDDLLQLGRWDEAQARLLEAERFELGITAQAMLLSSAGRLHALRGDGARAREQLQRADALAAHELPSEMVTPIQAAWATLALAEECPRDARRHVEAAFASIGASKDLLYTPHLHSLGVRAEAELAEDARTRRDTRELEESQARARALLGDLDQLLAGAAAGAVPPTALAEAALAEAELGRVEGTPDPERWHAAAVAWERLDQPYPLAYARLREAEATLTTSHRRAAAASLLVSAHATAATLAARPLADHVARLARRARIDLTPASAPEATSDHGGLTAREVDVLALLSEGLTNRQIAERLFISERTVNAHLTHIFGKLDVHTRMEAASRAERLGVARRST